MALLNQVSTGMTTVLGWIKAVLDALLTGGTTPGALNALLPLVAVSISISAIMLGVRMIKSFCWGA